MTHDEQQHGVPERGEARGSNGVQPEHADTPREERADQEETVRSDGVETSRSEARRGGKPDKEEERLVAFIRNEVQQTTQYYFEATPQLHSADSLAKYKEIDPDFPNRLLAMAERDQEAHIDADLIPIKAEAYGFKFAVTAASLFPALVFVLGIVLILMGKDVAGYITAAVGAFGGGAQLVNAVKPRKHGRTPPSDPQ